MGENEFNKYFYCYSRNLRNYFTKNGLPYIETSIHNKTNKRYWVYPSGRMVDILLEEYKDYKQNN